MDGDRVIEGVVIVGCSRRKIVTSRPVPALDLYQGWCIPPLRDRIGARPAFRARVLVFSARHGLIGADTPIHTYEQRLGSFNERTEPDPAALETLVAHLRRHPAREALLLLEGPYLAALGLPPLPVVHIVSDPVAHLDGVHRILTTWSWP